MRSLAGIFALSLGICFGAFAHAQEASGYSSITGSSAVRSIEESIAGEASAHDPMLGSEEEEHSPGCAQMGGLCRGDF